MKVEVYCPSGNFLVTLGIMAPGKEVSCRGLNFFFEYLDKKGIARDKLVDGLPYSIADLTKTGNWISWQTFLDLEHRMAQLFPEDPNLFFEMGRGIENTVSFGIVRIAVRNLVSPFTIYKTFPRFLERFLFPFVKITMNKTGPDTIHARYRFQEGYRPTQAFIDTVHGLLTGIPAMVKAPYADVAMTRLSDYEYDFDIRLTKWRGPIAGVKGFGRRVARTCRNFFLYLREGIHELEETNRILEEKVDQLTDLTQHLEERVRERTAMLQKRTTELERANEDLSILTTDMEDLLHAVAHDLKSPLINIQGFTKRLVEELTPLREKIAAGFAGDGAEAIGVLKEWHARFEQTGGESVRFIEKSVSKMDVMVQGLLRLSRMGRTPEPLEETDLDQMLGDIRSVVSHQLERQRIDFVCHPLPTVRCRKNEINQVFSNLIVNAINYMGEKSERRIEVYCQPKNGGLLEFRVHDTGVGIREGDLERVFRIFVRLEAATTKGDGIGLNIVKKIVRGHGGNIWVTSKYGEGSTFHFTLPRQPGVSA